MEYTLNLPKRDGLDAREGFQVSGSLVIIGSNGSGKTRFGSDIEAQNHSAEVSVHRISAQKSLQIPGYVAPQPIDRAESQLFYGTAEPTAQYNHKRGNRWSGDPATSMLGDYNHVVAALFARSVKRDEEYVIQMRESQEKLPIPDTPIDTIKKLWNELMPQREINFEQGKVFANKAGQDTYLAAQMSDGERVALYLIAQCLLVPDGGIIIIDEPELHLHRSLMSRLWNKIEELCVNKILIYITHDLEFAASRVSAKKIWIKEFNGTNAWVWEEMPDVEGLPKSLVLEIVGNRKNVIFVEGERSSLDTALYQAAFPDYHIIPRGGCAKVIESTKAMRDNAALHHLRIYGIIDIDYRVEEELTALRQHGIYSINVAEVENLFCIETLLRIAVEGLHRDDQDAVVENVKNYVFNALNNELETQITNHAASEIRFRFSVYTREAIGLQGLNDGFTKLVDSVNVEAIYNDSRALYENALRNQDYAEVLRIYNRKSLATRISPSFGLVNDGYPQLILRLLKTEKKDEIIAAIQAFMPTFDD